MRNGKRWPRGSGTPLLRCSRATLRVAMLAASVGLSACATAGAQGFDVPQGFVLDHLPRLARQEIKETSLAPVLEVRPEEGAFSDLSSLSLYEVEEPVVDPETWLKERVTLNILQSDGNPNEWLNSPDSPFGDMGSGILGDLLPELIEGMNSLGRLPLEGCTDPVLDENEVGSYYRLDCDWGIGPLHRYHQLRLQEVDGTWYLTSIETMNERRLRHLVAIANAFHR